VQADTPQGALLRGGLAHAPRKASARSENQQYHLTEPLFNDIHFAHLLS